MLLRCFFVTLLCAACAHSPAAPEPLAEVAAIHGEAGPWAVAGYRMGQYALAQLGLPRGSFDVEVVHFAPHEVQYSCIADGAAAATGASIGKLNLAMQAAGADETRTTYRNKVSGQSLTLRLTAAFRARYLDLPRARIAAAGREVLALPDAQIFERAATGP
jgi:formylmethanofuran dehydrogenase subunit E